MNIGTGATGHRDSACGFLAEQGKPQGRAQEHWGQGAGGGPCTGSFRPLLIHLARFPPPRSCTWPWPSSPWLWSPAALATTRSLRAPTSSPASRTWCPRWVLQPGTSVPGLNLVWGGARRGFWRLPPGPSCSAPVASGFPCAPPHLPLHSVTSTRTLPTSTPCPCPTASNCDPRWGQVPDQRGPACGGRPGGDERW